MSLAVEGPVTDHLHATHELPDLDYCSICMGEFLTAYNEHAWMGQAVKSNPTNPYAPRDPQAPERDWYVDDSGYVKVDR